MALVPMDHRSVAGSTYNNSYAAKSSLSQKPVEEKPKLDVSIKGGISLKRKTPGQRFRDIFIDERDLGLIGESILRDVVKPALLEMLFTAGRDALSMFLFGDTRASGRGTLRTGGGIVRDYSSMSTSIVSRSRDRDRVDNLRSEDSINYNNLVFTNIEDAHNVLYGMRDYINHYNCIPIVRLYELVRERVGIAIPMNSQDAKFGWTDLTDAYVQTVRGGFLLNLPNPIVLDD